MIRKRQSGLSERLFVETARRRCPGRRAAAAGSGCRKDSRTESSCPGMTYTVDETTDTGAGSGTSGDLRYAITQANANPGSTIQFSVSGTIALESALPELTANVTIDGPGASDLTIQGTSSNGVFYHRRRHGVDLRPDDRRRHDSLPAT